MVACKGRKAGRAPVWLMPGWIMPAPLQMPPSRAVLAAQLKFHRDFLGPRVAGHDGFGGVPRLLRRALPSRRAASSIPFLTLRHRQRHADAPGGGDQHLARGEIPPPGPAAATIRAIASASRKPWRPVQALALPELTTMARATPRRHPFHAKLDRRGANAVGGEGSRHRRGGVGNDQRQVPFPAFVGAFAGAEPFDVAKHSGGPEALRRGDRTADVVEGWLFHRYRLSKRRRWVSSRIFLRIRRLRGVASTYSSGPMYSRARSRDIFSGGSS